MAVNAVKVSANIHWLSVALRLLLNDRCEH